MVDSRLETGLFSICVPCVMVYTPHIPIDQQKMSKPMTSASSTTNNIDNRYREEEDANADVELEDFFRDIEKLMISQPAFEEGPQTAATDETTTADELPSQKSRFQEKSCGKGCNIREELMGRADTSQQSWQEFSTTLSSTNNKPDRPLVSFTINKSKGKKTKTTKKAASSCVEQQATDEKAPLPPAAPPSFQRPRWIVVLDTCAVLESHEDICYLISAAVHAATQLRTSGCGGGVMGVEPITVVIPYKIWTELDYRSKQSEEEDLRYRARRAARMLNKELDNHGQHYIECRNSRIDAVIRSQSRVGLDNAARDFLSTSVQEANNDDHILFCARAEQQAAWGVGSDAPPTTGGVVLLTQDNVLSGKARADGVAVYTPAKFVEYYTRRADSLRDRTSQDIVDAALQRRRR